MESFPRTVPICINQQVLTIDHSENQQNKIWSIVEPVLKTEFGDIYEYFELNGFETCEGIRHSDIILGPENDNNFEEQLPWIAGYLNFKSTALLHAFATTGKSGEILRDCVSYAGRFIHSDVLDLIFTACESGETRDEIIENGHGSKAGSRDDMVAKYIRSACAMAALDKNVFSGPQPGVESDLLYDHGIEVEDLCRFHVLVSYVLKGAQPKEPKWPILAFWRTDEVKDNEPVVSELVGERSVRRAWCESNRLSTTFAEQIMKNVLSTKQASEAGRRKTRVARKQRSARSRVWQIRSRNNTIRTLIRGLEKLEGGVECLDQMVLDVKAFKKLATAVKDQRDDTFNEEHERDGGQDDQE